MVAADGIRGSSGSNHFSKLGVFNLDCRLRALKILNNWYSHGRISGSYPLQP